MQEAKGTVFMAGEKMDVLISAGCIRGCRQDIALKLPMITNLLCASLERPDVARHFINKIRIGDTVTLVDRENGYAFRLEIHAHSVNVLSIYKNTERPKYDSSQIVLLLNHRLWSVNKGRNAA